jgi:hypothetical protein
MKTAQDPAGQYLKPRISEERVRQTWARILGRHALRRQQSIALRRALVPAVTLAIGVCVFVVLHRSAPRIVSGNGLTISSEAEPRTFDIASGFSVDLQPFASVTLAPADPSEQRVVVARGAARFRVSHDPTRRFVVSAGAVEVVDMGTVFTVAREGKDGELVRVSVASGDVEVRVGGQAPRPLHVGESLTTSEPSMTQTAPTQPLARVSDTPLEPAPAPPEGSRTLRAVEPVSAKSLLAAATAARQAGDASAEAQALDTLRKRFPHDPRGPIAAFELGRLRMDQLGDRPGALEAFRAAIALGSGASLREDAEARVIGLLDELGDATGCRASRDAFLSRYPASVHRSFIQRRCQTP